MALGPLPRRRETVDVLVIGDVPISERRVLTFKASQILKIALNERAGHAASGSNPLAAASGDSTATKD